MTGLQLVTGLVLLTVRLHKTDCMVYHVTFLGRNSIQSAGDKVGELHYQGTASTPTVTNDVGCIWEPEGNTNIKKLVPYGTCLGLIPDRAGISASGFKVEAPDDFILHVYQSDPIGILADGYLAIPDEHLGKEYYVETYCSLGGFCQFAVVGTVDKTRVNIVFPREVSPASLTCNGVPLPVNAPPGKPIPFLLNENQVLHIESTESKTDLSGTYIASDREVAVFVGARDVPSASGSAAFMIEQIPPINKWGTDFVVAPNYLNDAGDIIKIVTKSEETTVHILGFSPFTISNQAESVERRIDWQMHSSIHASKPILIVQVMALNLYNDTTIVTGSPAMVLVPNVEQWTDRKVYTDCLQSAENQSVLTVVAEKGKEASLVWYPPANGLWENVNGTGYSVLRIGPTSHDDVERLAHGVYRSTYGYCDGKSAVLLDAKWDWENKDCTPTAPVPGDGMDNDCDGKIDEDVCTQDDTALHFTSTQNAETGETTFKSIIVKGASPVRFKVTSCDIIMVTLQMTSEPVISYTAQITPSSVVLQVCTPECHGNYTIPIDGADCDAEQTYTITWSTTNRDTTHTFKIGSGTDYDFKIPDLEFDYDVMFVTAFSSTADFVLELLEKDCGKIKSGDDADNFGVEFVFPVTATDIGYVIFLTNPYSLSVNVALRGEQGSTPVTRIIGPEQTLKMEKADLNFNDQVIIEATSEISVYVVRKISSEKTFGHSVLPFDILGPSYHVFLDSSYETATTDTICTGYATTDNTDNTESNVGPVTIDITKDMYNNELGHQKLLTANRPIAMFCGGVDNMAQMPPRESLGKQHYIPPLDLSDSEEFAEIRLVATEDSTVVIIRGNYDNLDTVELTGNIHTRAVVKDMLYNISSTKPIQVHLQIRSSQGWSSVIVIPPVEQYKSDHVFPCNIGDIQGVGSLTSAYRTAVNENGEDLGISVVPPCPDVEALSYEAQTFSLTVLQYGTAKLIVPSDVMYNSINKVCHISPGTPGDGVDNDCDGLTDEEQCTAEIVPGVIDADIDGSLNEDCADGTTSSSSPVIDLSLTSTEVTCPANQGSGSGSSTGDEEGGITVDNGMQEEIMSLPTVYPKKAISFGSGPSYPTIASSGGSIALPDTPETTAAPGSTGTSTAPVETCTTDCVCPCGWVEPPKNYTIAELKAVVIEIQEKLKVSKNVLSSTVRRKSSAKDDRTEAAAVGVVGVVFLVAMIGAVILLDITTLVRHVKMFIGNLRQVFQH